MNIVDGSPVGTSRCRGNNAGSGVIPDQRVLDEEHSAVGPDIENALLILVGDHHVLKEDRGCGDNLDAVGSSYSLTVAGHAANFDGLRWIVCQACSQNNVEAGRR